MIKKRNGILFLKINIKRQSINSYSLCNTFNIKVFKILTYYIKNIYLINKNEITVNTENTADNYFQAIITISTQSYPIFPFLKNFNERFIYIK